jgi:small subunit ribosomal protein S4
MARYTGPKCRLCRRTGETLCAKARCALERRPNPPGQRSPRRRKVSDRGRQLLEKQKARYTYGILERQFRRMYKEATRRSGATGDNLVQLLELRLDNVVYRAGLAESRPQARQIVCHGHITINGHKADIPSIQTKVGDRIGWTARGKGTKFFENVKEWQGGREVPGWIAVDPLQLEASLTALPLRTDVDTKFDENAIVEYYSR